MQASRELKLIDEIAQLETLSREDLVAYWVKAYGVPPFKGARHTTLVRGLAYHLQCKTYGGIKPKLSRQLLKIANIDHTAKVPTSENPPKQLKTQLGTQLVREWNGKTHTVHVTDKGCVLNGVTYSSLSAAAKAITGAHWSGPRFFGVAS